MEMNIDSTMETDFDKSTYSDSGLEIRARLNDFPEHYSGGTYVFNFLDDIPEDFDSVLIPALVAASATLSISPDNNPPPKSATQPPPQQPTASPVHKPATFSTLPTEIRTMIWRLARPPPRIVRVRRARKGYPAALISDAKIPNLLHINRESRKLALGWYRLCFGETPLVYSTGWSIPNCRPHVYFDFSSGVFYPGCAMCLKLSCEHCMAVTNTRDVEKVQNVLFHFPVDDDKPFTKFVGLFPNARELMVLMQNINVEPDVQFSQLKEIDQSSGSWGPDFLWTLYLSDREFDKKNREKYVAERVAWVTQEAE
jgi:hypothetical protein